MASGSKNKPAAKPSRENEVVVTFNHSVSAGTCERALLEQGLNFKSRKIGPGKVLRFQHPRAGNLKADLRRVLGKNARVT
jgi:hypothetical protein